MMVRHGFRAVVRAGLCCLTVALVSACGQRGPLYLPDKPATKVEHPGQPADKEEPKKKDE